MMNGFIEPAWPAPTGVRAASTTRQHGVSQGPFHAFNLGAHVDDRADAVGQNRLRLRDFLGLPSEPVWLRQVHGCQVVDASSYDAERPADAAVAREPGLVCVVLTADCLPVLFCDRWGREVAAAHAGWRGLAAGVLEETVSCLHAVPENILAWIGPCIGPERFEVGGEVRDAFVSQDGGAAESFRASPSGRWLADLPGLARRRLRRLGIRSVFGGTWCTYSEPERFFSYRREPRTGRMATLIWIE